MNSTSFSLNSLFVHSLVCPITHSFLNEFQPNLCQHSIFSKHMNVFELQIGSCHNLDPLCISFRYIIYIDVPLCSDSLKNCGLVFLEIKFQCAEQV